MSPSPTVPAIRTVAAARYVMPFKEGSSVPALVEGDDLGLYVVKLRGAGQGEKALIAELLAGEIARAMGLSVPEIVLVELDRALAATEPDPEIFDPLDRSAGLNLGLDYLPGSITYDPVASPRPDALTASKIVLLDAFVTNVDRTPRNPNLLVWHKRPWLIDHGAALYFHHGFDPHKPLDGADDPFVEVKSHVLGRWATQLDEAANTLRQAITDATLDAIVDALPTSWLEGHRRTEDAAARREVYRTWLRARRDALPVYLEEAQRAHARLRLRHRARGAGRRARRVRERRGRRVQPRVRFSRRSVRAGRAAVVGSGERRRSGHRQVTSGCDDEAVRRGAGCGAAGALAAKGAVALVGGAEEHDRADVGAAYGDV